MPAPTDILRTPAQATVNENAANGTSITVLTTVDADPSTYTWTLVDSAGGRFALSGNTLVVGNGGLLDFEIQEFYTVIVRVTEGTEFIEREFSVQLKDVLSETLVGTAGNDRFTGGLGTDSLSGGNGSDYLAGGAGNDTLGGGSGINTLTGGSGDDLYYVDSTSDVVTDDAVFGGTDTVVTSISYTLPQYIENLTASGSAAVNLTGNDIKNVLVGNTAGNVLDGKGGADTMIGGAGNDTYQVDNTLDVVQEATGGGIDTVISTVSYSLAVTGATPAREVENLTLAASTVKINATGNALANTLTGNDTANVLDGREGADTMIGGLGDDTYYVDTTLDVVTEASATGGTDTVFSSSAYSLAAIANVENLTLSGIADVSATGNSLANTIVGNTGENLIDGGAGNDSMSGGRGNDTYILDSTSDKAIESANSGTDTVRIGATFSLAQVLNVERLELQGTGDLDGTGNSLDNQLVGNGGDNALDGGTGNDTLAGGTGNDTYTVDSLFDVVSEAASAGTDHVDSKVSFTLWANIEDLTLSGFSAIGGAGNISANTIVGSSAANSLDGKAGNDTIDGGSGNDTIAGGAGNDSLTGGAGNDVFYFESGPNGTTNVDTIVDFVVGADSIGLAHSVFAGLGSPGALAATAFVAGTTATSAASRILYDRANGNLFYDADGTGSVAAVKIGVVASRPVLSAADFEVMLAAPTLTLANDNGSSSTDKVTNSGLVNVTGLLGGATWQYSTNGGSTWTNGTGTSFTLTGDGPKTIIARQTDGSGNVSSASSALSFTLDTLAPSEAVASVVLSSDTGTSATDFVTKTASQTITGTLTSALAVGNVVKISLDNGATWQTAAAAPGTSTFTLGGVTLTGTNTLIARVEDSTGHKSSSFTEAYVLDTSAPTTTVPVLSFSTDTGFSSTDFITNAAAQTITGTLSTALAAGDIVKLSLDNGSSWQTLSVTPGSTSFSLAGVTLTGSSTMLVRVEDAAGNLGTTRSQAYALDTAPPAERVATVAFSADNGVSATDFITSVPAQTISGTLTAALAAGNLVRISLDNGLTWQTATATTGSTTFTLGGVTLALGSNTMIVRVEDAAGNPSLAKVQSYALEPPAPSETVATVDFSVDSGASATDFVTNAATQTITGTLSAALALGNVVKVSLDNGATWQTATAATGSTNFTLSGVTLTGSGTLIARVEDTQGRPSAARTQAYVLDTTVATPSLVLADDSGSSATDRITDTGTVTVSGLEAGATWQYSTNGGSTWTTGSGSSFTLTGDGAKSVLVRQTDVAGNTSALSTALAFTLDTAATAPTLALATDSGTSTSDRITDVGTVNVTGLEAGATWQYSTNGGTTWSAGTGTSFTLTGDGAKSVIVRQTDAAGNVSANSAAFAFTLDTGAATPTLALATDSGASASDRITKVGTVNVTGLESGATWQYSTNGGSTWTTGTGTSFTLTGDGAKSVIVRQTDDAGNLSANSAALAYTLDTTVATPTLALATDSGASASDRITSVGTVNVTGLEAGATWQYSSDGGTTWSAGSGSSFTLTGDGAKSVLVRQTDTAGNLSANSAAFAFTLDTGAATPTLALATDSGASSSDRITSVGTVNVSGLEAGATWQYSTNGGSTWTTGTGSSFTVTGDGAKSVIVRQTDTSGNVSSNSSAFTLTLDTAVGAPSLALATDSGASSSDRITNVGTVNVTGLEAGATWQYSTNGGSTWTTGSGTSFTLTGDGAKSVIVRQTDTAGNASANSTALAYTLDSAIATPTLALATDSGASGSDRITNVGTVNVAGLEAGATWQYSTNGGSTWTTGSGTSFTLTGDGAKSVLVRCQ